MKNDFLFAVALFALLCSCQNNQPAAEKTIDSISAPMITQAPPEIQDSSSSDSQGTVMVILDYKKIAARGLTGGQVIDVLAKEEAHLKTIEDYRKVIAGIKGKDTIYLKEVATFKTMGAH